MRTGEDANIFRLPTIQSLQVFGKSSRKESGREKAKQEHKRAKVFHATPQPASPLAARLGSREGRHCPPLFPGPRCGFFLRALPLVTGKHLLPLQERRWRQRWDLHHQSLHFGWGKLSLTLKILVTHWGKKKTQTKPKNQTKTNPQNPNKNLKRKRHLTGGTRDHIKPRGAWSDLRADPAVSRTLDQRPPEAPSCLNYPVILQKKSEERLSPKTHFHHTGGYWSLRKQH